MFDCVYLYHCVSSTTATVAKPGWSRSFITMAFYANEYEQLYHPSSYCCDANAVQADLLLQGWNGDDQCWTEQRTGASTGFGELAPDVVDFLLMNDFDSYLPYLEDVPSPMVEYSNTSTRMTPSQSMSASQDSDLFDMAQRSTGTAYWSAPSADATCSAFGLANSGSYPSQSVAMAMNQCTPSQLEGLPQRTASTVSTDEYKPTSSSSLSGVVTPFNSFLKTYHEDGQLSLEDVNARIRELEKKITF